MYPHTEGRRVIGIVASCKKPADKAGQDIPAAALGHPGVARGVLKARPSRREDPAVVSLHHDGASGLGTELPGERFTLGVTAGGKEAQELPLMRSENRSGWNELRPLGHHREDIEGIGIQYAGNGSLPRFAEKVH